MGNVNTIPIAGMVYAMTNAAVKNEVIAFRRGMGGRLSFVKAYATGGRGTGEKKVDPLVSQGSLVLSPNGRFLFAVNAGSDSISSFHIAANGTLALADTVDSGGFRPNSLAVHNNFLYVTNVGNGANSPSNITGFRVQSDWHLSRIIGSSHPLSTDNAQPACVVFSPGGRQLIVSELNNNRLTVFHVNVDGSLVELAINETSGEGPFGSVFLSNGVLLNAEAGTNALSSYGVAVDGVLSVLSASVPTDQTATCWVSASRDEKYAYMSNTGSGTITIYRIHHSGMLEMIENSNSTRSGSGAPIDSGVSRDGRNFYVLNGNQGSVSVFRIRKNGLLVRLQVINNDALPNLGAQGLAVR